MWSLTPTDVDRLAFGAMLLASGGGAGAEENGYAVTSILRQALTESGPLPVLEPEEADPDGFGVRIGIVGSALLVREKLPSGREMQEALHVLEGSCGQRASAVIGLEMEVNNGLVPLILAARTGLPVVDVCGMGRAMSNMDQSTYAVAGLPFTPCAVTEPCGNRAVLESSGIDKLARMVTVDFGGWAMMVCKPLRLADAVRVGIPDVWARALELGSRWLPGHLDRRWIAPASEPEEPPAATTRWAGGVAGALRRVAERAAASGGFLLTRAKVVELRWDSSGDVSRGTVVLQHIDDRESFTRLEMQGEFLIALVNGEPVITCPDIICCLDAETGRPIGIMEISYGCVLDIVALPAPEQWMEREALSRVDPRAFGYGLDYVPFGQHVMLQDILAPRYERSER